MQLERPHPNLCQTRYPEARRFNRCLLCLRETKPKHIRVRSDLHAVEQPSLTGAKVNFSFDASVVIYIILFMRH
jgi:hypothetical protein